MANIKLSTAKYGDIKPYKLPNNIKIYSVEEAIYLFYTNFTQYNNEFFEDKFIKWIQTELIDTDMANRLIDIKMQNNFYQKSIDFLTINDFYTLDEIEKISIKLFDWEKRGYLEREKIKGDKYLSSRIYDKAIDCYKNALDFDNLSPVLYNNIGICYMQNKDYKNALYFIQKAYKISPDNNDILINYILLLLEIKNYAIAYVYIKKIQKSKEQNYYLGILHYKQKKYDEAIKKLKSAYDIKKDENTALYIAKCYVKKGIYKKVYEYLGDINCKNIDILIQKGEIFEEINDIDMAIKCIERALFYDKENAKLWTRLSRYFREKGDILKADSAIQKSLFVCSDDIEALFEQTTIKKNQKQDGYIDSLLKVIKKGSEEYRKNL